MGTASGITFFELPPSRLKNVGVIYKNDEMYTSAPAAKVEMNQNFNFKAKFASVYIWHDFCHFVLPLLLQKCNKKIREFAEMNQRPKLNKIPTGIEIKFESNPLI